MAASLPFLRRTQGENGCVRLRGLSSTPTAAERTKSRYNDSPMLSPELTERAAAWSRHEHARRVLGQVLEACRSSTLRVVPVKGVLTAHLLYKDPSERRMQDIDLRVSPEDFPRLEDIAVREGFRVLSQSRTYRNLVLDVDGMMVEFEAHIGPRALCDLSVTTVLSRAEEHIAPFGFPHLQPELHDHALLLVVNAYKDKVIEAAEWAIRDLELLGSRGDFEPKRLAELAKASGVSALTWIVADWLADIRGQAAWSQVRGLLADAPRKRYREMMRSFLRGTGTDRWPEMMVRVLARAASDRAPQSWLALATSAVYSVEAKFSGGGG